MYCANFSKDMAREYLNYCWIEKKVTGKTYNSYLKGYHSIFAWLVEFGYMPANDFSGFTTKKETQKTRIEISPELR